MKLDELKKVFEDKANKQEAISMSKYMRNK